MRKKSPLIQTYLCAVKFWRVAPAIPTMASGVRHVVRRQGFTSKDIYKIEKEAQRSGQIIMTHDFPKTVALTHKGEQIARCGSVKLAPWTDEGYPGSRLEGTPRFSTAQSRKRIRKLRRQGCEVEVRNIRGTKVVLKKCSKRKK